MPATEGDIDNGAARAALDTAGPGVRAFVAVFLTAFVACGILQVEAWPFSGWKLFSQLRTDEIRGWLATGVEAGGIEDGGIERPIPFGSFPPGHRGELQVLKGFDALSPEAEQDVCRAWADELARIGTHVVEIRIYATIRSARDPDDERRVLHHVCVDP